MLKLIRCSYGSIALKCLEPLDVRDFVDRICWGW